MSVDAENPVEIVRDVLEHIADALGVEAEVEVSESGSGISAEYIGDDLSSLIGHHGTTIDAIQNLAYRIACNGEVASPPVTVEAGGYRERRAEALCAMGDQAAAAAIRDGQPVSLEPMRAPERKVVHEHLKGRRDIETYSEGQEPSRRLVVARLVD